MLSFAHPLFLWGLLGLGAPVFLHLMHRTRARAVVFPSIRFIRSAPLPRGGRRRIDDWLLLLLRLAALALAVLALARPRWSPRRLGRGITAKRRRPVVFLVDLSASLAMKGAAPRARAAVRTFVQKHSGRRIGLVLSSDHVLAAIPPTADPRLLLRTLDAARPSLRAGNHAPALQKAAALLTRAGGGTLVIVSDFQETDWGGMNIGRLHGVLEARPVDVARGIRTNTGVAGVRVRHIGNQRLRVTVYVKNYGFHPSNRWLRVHLGKNTQAQKIVTPPGTTIRVPFVFDKPGATIGRAVLEADDYPLDDAWWFWAGPVPRPRALIVAPLQDEPAKRLAAFFVKKALEAESAGVAGYQVDTVDTAQFFALNLDALQAVLLLGAAGRFSAQDFSLLRRFLERGGLAVVTPGKTAAIQCRKLANAGLLAADFLGIAGRDRRRGEPPFALGWIAPDTPIGRLFHDPGKTDLFLFPVYRYLRMRPPKSARVLLKTENGDPVLCAVSVGRGQLYSWSFGFDPLWSDLPFTTSFLPLLRGVLDSEHAGERAVRQLTCGARVHPPADLLGKQLAPPPPEKTERPGVFLLGDRPYEVNVSRRESVLRKIDPAVFCARIQTPSGVPGPVAPTAGANSAGRELRGTLLAAAMIFFGGELLLSGRTRKDRTPSAAPPGASA